MQPIALRSHRFCTAEFPTEIPQVRVRGDVTAQPEGRYIGYSGLFLFSRRGLLAGPALESRERRLPSRLLATREIRRYLWFLPTCDRPFYHFPQPTASGLLVDPEQVDADYSGQEPGPGAVTHPHRQQFPAFSFQP